MRLRDFTAFYDFMTNKFCAANGRSLVLILEKGDYQILTLDLMAINPVGRTERWGGVLPLPYRSRHLIMFVRGLDYNIIRDLNGNLSNDRGGFVSWMVRADFPAIYFS